MAPKIVSAQAFLGKSDPLAKKIRSHLGIDSGSDMKLSFPLVLQVVAALVIVQATR